MALPSYFEISCLTSSFIQSTEKTSMLDIIDSDITLLVDNECPLQCTTIMCSFSHSYASSFQGEYIVIFNLFTIKTSVCQ